MRDSAVGQFIRSSEGIRGAVSSGRRSGNARSEPSAPDWRAAELRPAGTLIRLPLADSTKSSLEVDPETGLGPPDLRLGSGRGLTFGGRPRLTQSECPDTVRALVGVGTYHRSEAAPHADLHRPPLGLAGWPSSRRRRVGGGPGPPARGARRPPAGVAQPWSRGVFEVVQRRHCNSIESGPHAIPASPHRTLRASCVAGLWRQLDLEEGRRAAADALPLHRGMDTSRCPGVSSLWANSMTPSGRRSRPCSTSTEVVAEKLKCRLRTEDPTRGDAEASAGARPVDRQQRNQSTAGRPGSRWRNLVPRGSSGYSERPAGSSPTELTEVEGRQEVWRAAQERMDDLGTFADGRGRPGGGLLRPEADGPGRAERPSRGLPEGVGGALVVVHEPAAGLAADFPSLDAGTLAGIEVARRELDAEQAARGTTLVTTPSNCSWPPRSPASATPAVRR